ncbi:hypothetical protein GCM10028778_20640 [Barrientosiimonas marina]|uniref:FixH family protein n=1 Tax=Lentibacillus kimchii TaxID=1542911 RepID=A0ABW2UZJ2_9BACI
MNNKLSLVLLLIPLALLASCGDDDDNESVDMDDVKMLKVDFEPPKTVDVDKTFELKANVTYGDSKVTDAEEMRFEYWKKGDKDNSTFVKGDNNEDGTYTTDVSFDDDGVYEVYAHTSARDLHTMPKRYIAVGDATEEDVDKAKEDKKHENEDGSDNDE